MISEWAKVARGVGVSPPLIYLCSTKRSKNRGEAAVATSQQCDEQMVLLPPVSTSCILCVYEKAKKLPFLPICAKHLMQQEFLPLTCSTTWAFAHLVGFSYHCAPCLYLCWHPFVAGLADRECQAHLQVWPLSGVGDTTGFTHHSALLSHTLPRGKFHLRQVAFVFSLQSSNDATELASTVILHC